HLDRVVHSDDFGGRKQLVPVVTSTAQRRKLRLDCRRIACKKETGIRMALSNLVRSGHRYRQAHVSPHAVDGDTYRSCRHQVRKLAKDRNDRGDLFVVFGLEHFAAAIEAVRADVMTQMKLAGGGLDSRGRR